jgi:methionyl-tRNA formyltransferase
MRVVFVGSVEFSKFLLRHILELDVLILINKKDVANCIVGTLILQFEQFNN